MIVLIDFASIISEWALRSVPTEHYMYELHVHYFSSSAYAHIETHLI